MLSTASAYHELTAAWVSSAGHGPTLRGRRYDGPATTLHFVHGNGFCGGVYWPMLQQLMRSEEHTSELQSLMRISYAVFCLKKKKKKTYYFETYIEYKPA